LLEKAVEKQAQATRKQPAYETCGLLSGRPLARLKKEFTNRDSNVVYQYSGDI
jgi:hypothetical protein